METTNLKPIRVILLLFILCALLLSAAKESWAEQEFYSISGKALDSEITIKAQRSFGGSITSLIFRGKEYINADDKGRELQSASSFDELGECFNPTEAGGAYDKRNSSSHLISAEAKDNLLETEANMAFWRFPGQVHPQGRCGERTDVVRAQNKTILSGHNLLKRVIIGYQGMANVIQYNVTFKVPDAYLSARFVPISYHTTRDFSVTMLYDMKTRSLLQADPRGAERGRLPFVLMTPDHKNAVGIICPFVGKTRESWYGHKSWPTTNVVRCVEKETNIARGPYSYDALIIVGTADEVKEKMDQLLR